MMTETPEKKSFKVALNRLNTLMIGGLNIKVETYYDFDLLESWDDVCTLWTIDDNGSSYSQDVSLMDASRVKRKIKNLTILFEDVIPYKKYSCVIDQGEGKSITLFQHYLITPEMAD